MSAMGQINFKSKKKVRFPRPEPESQNTLMSINDAKISSIMPIMDASNMEGQLVPEWINKSQFVEILSESEPKFADIQKFCIMPALSTVDTYSSLILRVSMDVKLTDKTVKSMSFMMKVPHESAKMQQMLKTVNFFTVENATYTELISKFENVYKLNGLDVTFAPRVYKFKESLKTEPKLMNTVLMYDLSQDGYRNLNRLECLKFEETKLVLLKLAQYHAAGAHCRLVDGPYPDVFTQQLFGSNKERALSILEGIMGPFKKMFLENLNEYKNGEKYLNKFVALFSKMSEQFLKLSTSDPNEFNVINHGDCWINNLLFKFGGKKKLIDVKFVDFQLPKYGHPSADLLNFIMTSVHIDHKLKDFDYFIKYYHDQLTKHLKFLDYEGHIPKLKDLQMQLYKYGIWAVTASVMVLPLVLLDPSEEKLESASGKNILYANSRYKEYIEQILPWLDNRGLLES